MERFFATGKVAGRGDARPLGATARRVAGAVSALALLALGVAPAAALDLVYLGAFGASGPVPLNDPSGVAVAADSSVWVADAGLGRVLHFTRDGGYLGEIVPRPSQWRPSGVAVLSDGRIAVAAGDVTLHEADGSGMVALGLSGGCYGVAADAAGGIWVTQELDRRVRHWPGPESANMVQSPAGLALTADGAAFGTSALTSQVFRVPGVGGFTGLFPVWSPNILSSPTDIEPFGSGLLLADTWHHRLLEFDLELRLLGSFGTAGTGPGQFRRPTAIAVGPDGTVYVAELDNNRVSYFASSTTPARTSSWGRIKSLFR